MVTRTGDREIGVVSGRLPDNLGELACMGTSYGTELKLRVFHDTLFQPNDLSFLCVCSFLSSPVLRRLQMSKFICKSILVIDCKTVHIFVYSSTREQTKGLEQEWKWGDWDWRETLIFLLLLHTPIRHVCETTNLFTDFEKKNNCFAVYIGEDVMWLRFQHTWHTQLL